MADGITTPILTVPLLIMSGKNSYRSGKFAQFSLIFNVIFEGTLLQPFSNQRIGYTTVEFTEQARFWPIIQIWSKISCIDLSGNEIEVEK